MPALPSRFLALMLLAVVVLGAGPLRAQHEYSPPELEEGRRLYQSTCAGCHGASGDAVPGVDLGHGRFRRAASDDDLVRIITTGIAGTAMPPSAFADFQAAVIVGYLRSLAGAAEDETLPGDPARGRAIFEGKGACVSCHRVKGTGSRLGPDLSEVGQFHRAADLQRSVLDPDAEILPQNRFVRVVTRDGATTTGRLLNHDTFVLQLIDPMEQLRSYAKASLRSYAFIEKSSMPSYRDKLTTDELADLVRYLMTLKDVPGRQ
jgi:putative heme-binding domain-containing protein